MLSTGDTNKKIIRGCVSAIRQFEQVPPATPNVAVSVLSAATSFETEPVFTNYQFLY